MIKYKVIEGYDNYIIYENGSVFSIKRNKFLLSAINSRGYLQVSLRSNGKSFSVKIHRLVAMAFIHNKDNKPHINHINGIKTDNRIENLEWCSHNENMKHAWDMGLKKSTDKMRSVASNYRKLMIGELNTKSIKVIDTSNNIIYNTIREASKKINIDESYLAQMLRGKHKNNTNFLYYNKNNNEFV